ncbi:hypothetical protein PIB30_068688 [Stylosanthes scabra]|uniref:Uncharacterized protein n=1 Tax=Stylosanthes scabra TaxID=79078 RepID=A0ABU6YKJ1_9FABA|nr:hypothetical protein [Stylosanthes scabra]
MPTSLQHPTTTHAYTYFSAHTPQASPHLLFCTYSHSTKPKSTHILQTPYHHPRIKQNPTQPLALCSTFCRTTPQFQLVLEDKHRFKFGVRFSTFINNNNGIIILRLCFRQLPLQICLQ